jgi:hypothetical protein
MRNSVVVGGLVGVALVIAAGVLVALASSGGSGKTGQALAAPGQDASNQELAAARAATAKYQRVEAALADGYVPDGYCIGSPAGAMGDHYVRFDLLADGELDPEHPEVVLYVPGADGKPRLVALEYFIPDADQDITTSGDRPSLFGQPFDGPMEGHIPTMPIHYDLHVWVWENNPAGMFAMFNPRLTCPAP